MSEHLRKNIRRDVPPCANIKFRCAKLVKNIEGEDSVAHFNTIFDVLKSRGYKEVDEEKDDWTFHWADRDWIFDQFDKTHLSSEQKVNHFRNHYELTRKDLLVKNIKRARKQAEKEGNSELLEKLKIIPTTFVLPHEYSMFVEEFRKNSGSIWIMKPVGRSQGTGIFLVNKLQQINAWKRNLKMIVKSDDDNETAVETYVIQRYVEDPLTIGNKKFDLRLYVLVTSFQPLVVWIYQAGFCRFSMEPYAMDVSNLTAHLTNVSVQKQTDKSFQKEAYLRTGGKWALSSFRHHVDVMYGREISQKLFVEIEDVVLHSLISVQKTIMQDKHCFELFGLDVLIDSSFKPWLLEVNSYPSLTANTREDYCMKFEMLDDALTVLDMENFLTGDEKVVGGYYLAYKNGVRQNPLPENSTVGSLLGCKVQRDAVYTQMSKSNAIDEMGGRDAVLKKMLDMANNIGEAAAESQPFKVVAPVVPKGSGKGTKVVRKFTKKVLMESSLESDNESEDTEDSSDESD
eukprot:gene1298-274_t